MNASLYDKLRPFVLDEPTLRESGYPLLVPGKKGRLATIEQGPADALLRPIVPHGSSERKCDRCWCTYKVDRNTNQRCAYHPLKATYSNGDRVLRHPCCGAKLGDVKGCTIRAYHITRQVTTEALAEFCEAPAPVGSDDPRSKRVYALDAEMVYARGGMEVARLSLVDEEGRVVIDEYVRPTNPVLDYNTSFSGIVASNLESARHFLESIRTELFKYVDQSTILVGHSLESDLTALRVVHKNVVDTSETFRYGAFGSRKHSLRELAATILKVKIQQESHCSIEDAKTCMRLMRHKIEQEDAKDVARSLRTSKQSPTSSCLGTIVSEFRLCEWQLHGASFC